MKNNIYLVLLFVLSMGAAQAQEFKKIIHPQNPALKADFQVLNSGDVDFADVDGDGDQDVLITGQLHYSVDKNYSILYKNDGDGNFEPFFDDFIEVGYGSSDFADVDGDGDLDVVISGSTKAQNLQTKLYLNDGTGFFTEKADALFAGIIRGQVLFNDVDNDGDQDLLLTGMMSFPDQVTKLYKNDGLGGFTEVTTNLEQLNRSSIVAGDVNNDGYDDVVLVGAIGSGSTVVSPKLYLNDGAGAYEAPIALTNSEIRKGVLRMADVDGDGDLDILASGESGGSSLVFYTFFNENGTFTQGSTTITGITNFEISDIDNDGDVDVIVLGKTGVYKNDGTGQFVLDPTNSFTSLKDGAVAVADVNGDGLKDFLLMGRDGVITYTSLFINQPGTILAEVTDNYFPGLQLGDVELVDVDNDGDQDIIAAGQSNTDAFGYVFKVYKND